MKKMAVFMSKLSIGGMEKALVDLINYSDFNKDYSIDLYLVYKGSDYYLKMLPKNINIKLAVNCDSLNLFRKFIGYIKISMWKLSFLFKKYDVSICYSHHHKMLSQLTRMASLNNICFVHANLKASRNEKEIERLKEKLRFSEFTKIICVSDEVKKVFLEIYPVMKNQVYVANNYTPGDEILKKSKKQIKFKYDKLKKPVFINVSRHEDAAKGISKMIVASRKLCDDGIKDFTVILIGYGKDTNLYKKMIADNKLKEVVLLLGKKHNPYPFMKKADVYLLSSNYEGYGIVLNESRILKLPIISTDVADAKKICDEGYGTIIGKSVDDIYEGMKKFINKKAIVKKKFDYKKFNAEITKMLNKVVK